MTAQIITYVTHMGKVQAQQPYHCPECWATVDAAHVLRYSDYLNPRAIWKPLDDYARHLDYINCPTCGTCTRVARIGSAILPLDWPEDVDAAGEARIMAEALAFLVNHVPEANEDRAARIVWRLLARQITPAAAIRAIEELAAVAANGAIYDVLEMVPDVAIPPQAELNEVLRCNG